MTTRAQAMVDRINNLGGSVSVRSTSLGDRWSSPGFRRAVLDRLVAEGVLTSTTRGQFTHYYTR